MLTEERRRDLVKQTKKLVEDTKVICRNARRDAIDALKKLKKDSEITSLMELQDKKAIIVFGSTVERNLRSNVPNITIIGYKTYPEAFAALKEGLADAMISDDTILFGLEMKDDSVKILPKRYSKEPYAVAFAKGEQSADLVEKVDFEINDLVNRGVVRQLKAKWNID